jgi:hypothetical protein
MYVEAEAKMDSFQAQDGSQRTALNLLQRKYYGAPDIKCINSNNATGNFEALSRPRVENTSETTGAESDTDPANEPLSGVGAS